MNRLRLSGTFQKATDHLLFAGLNPLSPVSRKTQINASLASVPFADWLRSVGRSEDADGYSFIRGGISSGSGHSLISYRSNNGTDRIFSLGRNERGQIGVGYASQVPTRGLVSGFAGEEVVILLAGCESSYLVVREHEDSTALYVFGSLQRGRLAQPAFYTLDTDSEAGREPEVHLLSKATEASLSLSIASNIRSLRTGFEHFLLLSGAGELFGAGCNTDGQLGLGKDRATDVFELTKLNLPFQEPIVSIHAGADTSACITDNGQLFTWGNSEYSQGMHGHPIDQVLEPTKVELSSFIPSSRRIVDFVCGGSFSLLLDDQGSVYSAGYGALGHGPARIDSSTIDCISTLEGQGITRLRAKWGYAAAIRDAGTSSAIFTWGVNNSHGRLGLYDASQRNIPKLVYAPTEVALPLRELGLDLSDVPDGAEWEVGEVELGQDTLWVSLRIK